MMNIGFISTRFSGTDGVTLETSKWAQVFSNNGYPCFWFAGELDRSASISYLAPEAHFQDATNRQIDSAVMGQPHRTAELSASIHAQRELLKKHLYGFIRKFRIDMLVAENILSLPMHVPLGLAVTEVLAETGMPAIAHHHDFTWERERYLVNAVSDYLQMAFPPRLPNIAHAVINTMAREELARRNGLAATVVPNVLDFSHEPEIDPAAVQSFRQYIGLKPDDVMILQPTRVVQRKGIEHAIQLIKSLNRPKCKLVVSHQAGDEGFEYARYLERYAASQQVEVIFVDAHLGDPWGTDHLQYPQFSLYDIYPSADFVTYPSNCEGFGNGLLEAIYFNKPILTNRYPIFVRDIEPLGFKMVTMNGFLGSDAVAEVAALLDDPVKTAAVTAHNYQIARHHFSFETLQERLNTAMTELLGDRFEKLTAPSGRPASKVVRPRAFEDKATLAAEMEKARAYN